ncbi:unnamed protein product [Umbelopsis ramanniana]
MHYICALETPSIAFNANLGEKESIINHRATSQSLEQKKRNSSSGSGENDGPRYSKFNNSRSMEILKDTFEQKLPLVAEAIEQCDFLAIDAEFTGLHRYPSQHRFQTIQNRYDVFVSAVSNFAIIQFGICTFHWSSTANRYFAKPFNFYVFPRSTKGRREMNRCFGVQGEAFDFLTTCGFDFNKWVYHGISYLTPAEEKQFEKDGLERLNNAVPNIPVDRKEVEFMSNVRDQIDAFLKVEDKKKRNSLEIIALNGYRRRLVYQEVRNNYPQLTAFGKKDCICVCYVNERKEEQRYMERRMQFDKERKEAVGFRKVIDLISQSKKPVVGHNVLLDLCHMVNQFIAPLPQDVKGFKEMVHRRFPSVIDTKYLAAQAPDLAHFQSTSLENIYFETRLPPFEGPKIELHWDFPAYQSSKAHEAAYDAYITGYVFLRMANYIYFKTLPAVIEDDTLSERNDEREEESGPDGFYKFNVKANDDAPEVDISNVSWEKTFNNTGSMNMLWGNKEDEAATELNSELSTAQGGTNSAERTNAVDAEEQPDASQSNHQNQAKASAKHVTSPKELMAVQNHPNETNTASDSSEDEQNDSNIIVHFQNNGLLSTYVNKLSLIKSVAEYISLDEPEVLTDHSTVFHIFSRSNSIEDAQLIPIVTQLGDYFVERSGDRSVFVSYTQLPQGLDASKVDLDGKLKAINATVETLGEYIQNEASNIAPLGVRDAFNK